MAEVEGAPRPSFASLDGRAFDVVIIGGGISGASAAQHLAAAGYTVLLAERNDFASAATARSSRLLHNGLRYLAPPRSLWDFVRKPQAFLAGVAMARRSSKVGDDLVLASPHMVRTTQLLMPILETSAFRGWQVDLGAAFLKLIGRRKVPLNYRRVTGEAARKLPFMRWLNQDSVLESVAAIDDHLLDWPERIAIDCILDAERMGAVALNYTTAEDIERRGGRWSVGLRARDGAVARVEGTVLLNFAGVWVDAVEAALRGERRPARKIVGVKGVSILVELPEACHGVGIAGLNSHGEAIMCVPWGRRHYIGPTETVYEGDLDDVRPEDEDIASLIEETNRFLPGLGIDRSRILHAWAGVRPITYDPERAKGRRMPFSVLHDMSREGFPNMLTITWAAVMFHRATARRVVAAVGRMTAPTRAGTPLRFDRSARWPEAEPPHGRREIMPGLAEADIVRYVEKEHARDLVGIIYSRSGCGWTADITKAQVTEVARIAGGRLGWPEAEIQARISDFLDYERRYHLRDL